MVENENIRKECRIVQVPEATPSDNVIGKLVRSGIPVSGSIELTFGCNLKCVHCYAKSPAATRKSTGGELTFAEISAIIDQLVDEGCLWLLLTGGEPLLRPDFLDIYVYAKRKGLLVTLFTNGTLLTPDIADCLKEYPPYAVDITLNGISRRTYEAISGVPGSFERCLRGIDLVLQRGIPLKLKTMVMTINKHEFEDIKCYAEDLGVEFRFDPIINATLDGSHKPCELRLTPSEVLDFDLADEKRSRGYREFCRQYWGASKSGQLYDCGAGLNSFHIDPYGQMSICLVARWPTYDIRRGNFREGFYEVFPRIRSQKPSSQYQCGSCAIHYVCDNCPGVAHLETGDQEGVVEYFCQIAHLRATEFAAADKRV